MEVKEINELLQAVNEKAVTPTGNYYVLFVDDLKALEQYLLIWGLEKEGYYNIAGNNIFVIESPLNTLIDITDKFEKTMIINRLLKV